MAAEAEAERQTRKEKTGGNEMGKNAKNGNEGNQAVDPFFAKQQEQQPKSLPIAAKGIKTSGDFSDFMSAMMSDLVEGKLTPSVGNAACNAGGKLLKMVEMKYKYGSRSGGKQPRKTLTIAFEEEEEKEK